MSIRNFKLLIILITIILLVVMVSVISKKTPEGVEEANTEKSINFFADFLPFGKKKTNNENVATAPSDISNNGETDSLDKNLILTKVSSMPVSGFGVFQKERFIDIPVIVPAPPSTDTVNTEPVNPAPENVQTAPPTEFAPMVRYIEKVSGNVYQTFADILNEKKVSQTIVRGVRDGRFADTGKSVIMRYLKGDGETIASFVGSLPEDVLGADSSNNEVKGSFLPENVLDLSISPDTSKIFYLSKVRERVVGVVSTPLGAQKTQIFDSNFTEWLSSWPNQSMINLTTKASGFAPGYMYAIDPENRNWTRILGGINGLTTLTSPDGRVVLFNDEKLKLTIYDVLTKESRTLKTKTLPEKCVWGKSSRVIYCLVPFFLDEYIYPDSWYQGEISFIDKIWKIDLTTGNETMLLDPELSNKGERIDGINPTLTEEENYLFFMNKKDSYLWELKLK